MTDDEVHRSILKVERSCKRVLRSEPARWEQRVQLILIRTHPLATCSMTEAQLLRLHAALISLKGVMLQLAAGKLRHQWCAACVFAIGRMPSMTTEDETYPVASDEAA